MFIPKGLWFQERLRNTNLIFKPATLNCSCLFCFCRGGSDDTPARYAHRLQALIVNFDWTCFGYIWMVKQHNFFPPSQGEVKTLPEVTPAPISGVLPFNQVTSQQTQTITPITVQAAPQVTTLLICVHNVERSLSAREQRKWGIWFLQWGGSGQQWVGKLHMGTLLNWKTSLLEEPSVQCGGCSCQTNIPNPQHSSILESGSFWNNYVIWSSRMDWYFNNNCHTRLCRNQMPSSFVSQWLVAF